VLLDPSKPRKLAFECSDKNMTDDPVKNVNSFNLVSLRGNPRTGWELAMFRKGQLHMLLGSNDQRDADILDEKSTFVVYKRNVLDAESSVPIPKPCLAIMNPVNKLVKTFPILRKNLTENVYILQKSKWSLDMTAVKKYEMDYLTDESRLCGAFSALDDSLGEYIDY